MQAARFEATVLDFRASDLIQLEKVVGGTSMSQGHPIIVTVTGSTVDEIREKLLKYAREFGYDENQTSLPLTDPAPLTVAALDPAPIQAAAEQTMAAEPLDASPNAPKEEKRGRHPKNCACEKCAGKKTADAPAAESAAPQKEVKAPKAAKPASKEDVVAALQELQGATNLKAVIATLSKFGAKKASEIKEEDYAALVDECKKLVGSAKGAGALV